MANTAGKIQAYPEDRLPLLPLSRNGKRHEVVEAAIAGLAPPGEKPDAELLAFTLEFASQLTSHHQASQSGETQISARLWHQVHRLSQTGLMSLFL